MRLHLALTAAATIWAARFAFCATRTFSGSGYWTNESLWSGASLPAEGDDAVINGMCTNTVPTPLLASYTINAGCTNTLAGWTNAIRATNVFILGVLTHASNTDTAGTFGVYEDWTPDQRVWIECSNLWVDSGGAINVNGRGYAGGQTGCSGCGPGGGTYYNGGNESSGGGYGGLGGNAYYAGADARPYGIADSPTDPGSGGSGNVGGTGRIGGNGGGAVRVDASGVVTVNGLICADGQNALGFGSGGGSGGAIWISCRAFAGTNGVVRANGGSGLNQGGGGSGGRIAVAYLPSAQELMPPPSVVFSADGGAGRGQAQDGSLWLPDAILLFPSVCQTMREVRFFGFAEWSPTYLSVDGANLGFEEPHFRLATTAGGITVTNGATLTIASGPTNGAWPECGAAVAAAGDITVAAGSWIVPVSDPYNGGSVRFRMTNLAVAAGGGFNADARGYAGGKSAPPYYGYGPGGGWCDWSYPSGGGYGGIGGRPYTVNGTNFGSVYGSASMPLQPGSGGAGNTGGGLIRVGGAGGGLIWIEATNRVVIEGILTANGQNGRTYSAGGSGGAILILCKTISGSGMLSANGGNGMETGSGGGGGRIAVLYNPSEQAGVSPAPAMRFAANAGKRGSSGKADGEPGTVYLPDTSFYPYTQLLDSAAVVIPNFTNWSPPSLTLSNAWIRFTSLDVQSAGRVTVTGSDARLDLFGPCMFRCSDLVFSQGGSMRVWAGTTNSDWPNFGAIVTAGGTLNIGTGCWVYACSQGTNGGSVRFAAANVRVGAGGGFNADSAGYAGGAPGQAGFGPGGGQGGAAYSGGGGYGGTGGYANASCGLTYGSAQHPADPGSGAGGLLGGADRYGGRGGGLIHIEARENVVLEGAITCNGQDGPGWGTGGGSGGGIFVSCYRLMGQNGVLRANGGTGYNTYGGGGGGGRIAVSRAVDLTQGLSASVSGGTSAGPQGAPGTIVWLWRPLRGTMFAVR